MSAVLFPRQELWAQYHTVGPDGFADSDGQVAIRPTAAEASRIARLPGQVIDIAWVNFSFYVGDDGASEEAYPVGLDESFIATSKRSVKEVVFKPVSMVLEEGQLTKHTAKWLGYLAGGNHDSHPDQYDGLLALL